MSNENPQLEHDPLGPELGHLARGIYLGGVIGWAKEQHMPSQPDGTSMVGRLPITINGTRASVNCIQPSGPGNSIPTSRAEVADDEDIVIVKGGLVADVDYGGGFNKRISAAARNGRPAFLSLDQGDTVAFQVLPAASEDSSCWYISFYPDVPTPEQLVDI
jgi:hypothetical protein